MSTKAIEKSGSGKRTDVKRLAILAMFTALGYICLFLFRFKVSFLTLDFKDVFITMAGFVYGPLAALGVSLAESLLELATLSDTGFWGALMNFAGSAAFAVTASAVYKYNRNFKGAIIGLVSAVFCMTAVMLVMNLFITPIYAHTDMATVVGMILPLLLPFNLIKSVLNAALAFIFYKPVSQALKSIHLLPRSETAFSISKRSVIGLVIALAVMAAAVVVVISVFNGTFMVVDRK